MTIKKKRDFFIGVIFLAIAMFAFSYAQLTFEDSGLTLARGNMNPNSYPNFTLVIMGLFAVLLIISNITRSEIEERKTPTEELVGPKINRREAKPAIIRAAGGIGLTALYIFLIPLVGYFTL